MRFACTPLRFLSCVTIAALSLAGVSAAWGQGDTSTFRLATWNVTNYAGPGARDNDFKNALYGMFDNGTVNQRSMAPDVLVGTEFESQNGVNAFLNLLNSASGSPGDWAAAEYRDNQILTTDDNSAFFYRTSLIDFAGVTTIAVAPANASDPAVNDQPRDTQRYDFRVRDAVNQSLVSVYSVHLKSGSSGTDNTRRLAETRRIRDNAETLGAGSLFLVAGDMNVQSSNQTAYTELTGAQADNSGRFFDPINTPGTWENNAAFRFVHTQDPAAAGAMDSRHDQILMSNGFFNAVGGVDTDGFEYVGDRNVSYSNSTWNDPNHSYRAWGNDGSSFNQPLTTTGNSMVGAGIAASLRNAAAGGGHLPVFLDIRYQVSGVVVVPEPSTIGLMALATIGSIPVFARRRRKQLTD